MVPGFRVFVPEFQGEGLGGSKLSVHIVLLPAKENYWVEFNDLKPSYHDKDT